MQLVIQIDPETLLLRTITKKGRDRGCPPRRYEVSRPYALSSCVTSQEKVWSVLNNSGLIVCQYFIASAVFRFLDFYNDLRVFNRGKIIPDNFMFS